MYKSATVRPSSATLVNKISEKIKINNGFLNREDILKSFTPEILNKEWNCLYEEANSGNVRYSSREPSETM